jgi:hypothetical protein
MTDATDFERALILLAAATDPSGCKALARRSAKTDRRRGQGSGQA